jgi:hypothetical protein
MLQQRYVTLGLVALVLIMNLLGLSFTINRNTLAKRRLAENAQPQRALEHAPY